MSYVSGLLKFVLRLSGIVIIALAVVGSLAAAAGIYVAREIYMGLPGLEAMTDYKPKMPMRVYTADKVLVGEYGDERRIVAPLKDIPKQMKLAVLAAEDDRFYEHKGVDFQGVARAAINNFGGGARQGASTITQQLARNFYLTREQTFKRKAYEALLAWKIESEMTKDQILEIYMNQIFLGQRAYGFASAAQIYYGKPLAQISLAQSAMLAGLPKAPTAYNPVSNPKRSRERQAYILGRMKNLGYISEAQWKEALDEKLELNVSVDGGAPAPGAEYVSEMARQFALERFGEAAYGMGLNIFVTVEKDDQDAAVRALRKGVEGYDRAHGYRGPEARVDLPESAGLDAAIAKALAGRKEIGGLMPAVVLEASPKMILARLASGKPVAISGEGLVLAQASLNGAAGKDQRIARGSVIRVERDGSAWRVGQIPEVASSFVASDTHTGAIKALVGGFDFALNKFNRPVQAWRQPGSSFKPFIYSASLEKGLAPSTMINDSAYFYDPGHGGAIWAPKDYDGKGDGPMTMRHALTLSKNLVSARIVGEIGPEYAQQYALRFGFDAEKNPPVMSLALGAGAVTPLQMAAAYSAFANGGFKVEPYLVERIIDQTGKVVYEAAPKVAGDEANRVIEEANSYIMDTMLRDVAQRGTAARASAALKRNDLAGKTGTTNNAMDAWFCGYHPDIAGIAWIGFDKPKSLGSRETGGGLALPIWIDFMAHALKDKPAPAKRKVPDGVLESGGEVYLAQFPPGVAMAGLGLGDKGIPPGAIVEPAEGDSLGADSGGGQVRVISAKTPAGGEQKAAGNPAMDQGLIEAPEMRPAPKPAN